MTTTSRFHWWTSLALLVLCGIMAVVVWGPRKSLTAMPRRPEDRDVLRMAYIQYLLPDPHRRTIPVSAHNHFILSLWEPLVECNPATGQPQPAAAERWAWSADQLALTLKLRPDARWSNGDPVTAHDFVRSWLRLLRLNMEVAQTLFPLKNAEAYHRGQLNDAGAVGLHAIDDLTLRLELSQVRSTLVAELSDPLLSPLHQSTESVLADESYFRDPAGLITNGPFRLVKASEDGFSLQVCEFYHGRAGIRLAGVHFIRVDDLSIAPLLLAAGVVDIVSPMPFGEVRALPTNRPVKLAHELILGVSSIDLNVTRGPMRDVRVRQALALALHRVETTARFDPGRMVPAWSWIPSMPGRPGLKLLREDADEARRLLAEAGYPGGKGFPVLTMALPLWAESDPYPAAWVEDWFRELGVRTHMAYEAPVPQMKRVMDTGDYDVAYGALMATVPDAGDMLSTFLWPIQFSQTKWVDKDVVSLLNLANSQMDTERLATLEKAERLIMAAVPVVPVMFTRRRNLLAAEVQGWYEDPLARQSLKRLWLASTAPSSSDPEPRL
jgi:oligopeptide transport system substrate-binding protein